MILVKTQHNQLPEPITDVWIGNAYTLTPKAHEVTLGARGFLGAFTAPICAAYVLAV